MFYSRQLLARKAPLGQIWMAATTHAKINRRKLSKLNIIKICEEILNPPVPMALRLSGILMGGVVIVFERKVKLLYEDVTRFLIEINKAFEVKAAPDPTVLPKGKSQARKMAVTLPDIEDNDIGDMEQSLNYFNANNVQQTAYFAVDLDSVDVDELFKNENAREGDSSRNLHQADPEDITLSEPFGTYRASADMYSEFERFDDGGDREETHVNFTSGDHTHIPATLIPSPPRQEEPQGGQSHHARVDMQDHQINQTSNEFNETRQGTERQVAAVKRKTKCKTKREPAYVMDDEQTIIPGHTYQSWLQDTSDIVSRRKRTRKRTNLMATVKIATLMDIPPVVLNEGLFTNGTREIYYPPPLLRLWMKSIQPAHDSPSARASQPLPPEPSFSSPPRKFFEDHPSGVGSQPLAASIEKPRENFVSNEIPTEILADELIRGINVGIADTNPMVTPGNSVTGDGVISPSSGSEPAFPSKFTKPNFERFIKKRPSSSRNSSGGPVVLETVPEETAWQHSDPNFKLSKLPENGLIPDQELLVETGPTQTQQPVTNTAFDEITGFIQMQLKAHFDAPEAPKVESLNDLAAGMSRKAAAQFFYRTCVLATRDVLRVDQKVPYGDILISRGPEM